MSLIYGCMGLTELPLAEAAVEAALDSGITTFDHADIYGDGRAEAVFGEVLARSSGLRERIRVQTKCGIRLARGEEPGLYDLRGETIRARVHESLERLRCEVVDVLLLHRPDPLADPAEVGAALMALHREGVVRSFGVSNMGHEQIAALQAHLDVPLVADQLEMSLHRRDWLEAGVLVNVPGAATGFPLGTLEHCRRHRIELQAWGALAQGRFTGRAETPADHAATELVAALAERHATTPETVVLWWLQRHPAAIAPVVGTTNVDRIRACADAARRPPELTHEEFYALWIAARGAPLP